MGTWTGGEATGMFKPDFRSMARASLARAKAELEAGGDRLRYAALELRFAMEAVTYDRALAFKDEIPPEEYGTWQPRKLMQVLHDIDPSIGMTSTIAVGIEETPGVAAPPEAMQVMGTDVVFTLADLKRHYDAIGSHLHMPSLEQVMSGKAADPAKLKARCEEAAGLLEKALSSRVWNSTMGMFATLDACMRDGCGKPVRKRIPMGKDKVDVKCFECGAEYVVADQGDGKTFWEPKQTMVRCPTEGCGRRMPLWPDEVKDGTWWRCSECGKTVRIALMAYIDESEETRPDDGGAVRL